MVDLSVGLSPQQVSPLMCEGCPLKMSLPFKLRFGAIAVPRRKESNKQSGVGTVGDLAP